MKFKMNVPNALTMVRIACTPIIILLFMLNIPHGIGYFCALGVYVLACVTDFLDGYIARQYNLVTDFGKFMDPLADKLLVATALICLTGSGVIPAWVSVILIGREFVISGFRLIAAEKGVVIAAGIWGKAKTMTQMIAVIMLLSPITALWFRVIALVLLYASVALSLISVADYMVRNKAVLEDSGE